MAEEIAALIAALDATSDTAMEDAREKIVPLGLALLPHAPDGYARLRMWRGRVALIYTVTKFARTYPAALPALERAAADPDALVAADAAAAIDAIMHQNPDYFCDRTHSGRVHWSVGGSEPFI